MPGKISFFQRSIPLSRKTEQHSFRSVGIAIAPAMTLNRMYYCAPNDRRAMDPKPSPSSNFDHEKQYDRKRGCGGDGSGNLGQRLRNAREAGIEADGHSNWDSPQRAQQKREVHAEGGCDASDTDLRAGLLSASH
jgi:hypothetical protein